MKNEKQREVYADWIEKENLIGTLFASNSRSKDVYSFEFSDSWLYNFSDIMQWTIPSLSEK